MSQFIKNRLKNIIPRTFLFKNEEKLRKIYSLLYSGNNFSCPICLKNLKRFENTTNNDSICPSCGSLRRNRRLWILLNLEFILPNSTILDFSPSRCLYRKLKKRSDFNYISTDLSGDFIAEHQWDITNIDCPDATFDLILCYHILEHIKEDILAMKELFRVLKPEGKILVQTPFKVGTIYENETIVSEKERLIHFGQEDHVRIYSINGLKERLESCGFIVEVRHFLNEETKFDLSNDENILVLTKPIN